MSDSPFPAARPVALVAGKYEVLHLIGRGGMGSVWEGRHASLGTRVAIKFVDPEHAESEEARSRFVTEARAAAAIQSKHAIQIFDHGLTDDGRPYIVMELLVGEPLDARIERLGRMPLADTARVIAQVCRALARAHEAGIIHRDLKPENIFLVRSSEDDDEIAKVLDFGIAKIRVSFEGADPTTSTKTGAVLGTPYYMSPEQARGFRTIDHRTDLWSLGVIAYRCVTGVLPFEGRSVGDLLVNICTGPLSTPSLVAPELPASFDAWFARALERDPERRFASATELADALATAAGLSLRRGPPVSGASPSAPARGRLRGWSDDQATVAAANNTAAPFTSPAAPARSSRGRIAGILFVSLVGGSVGVAAVVRLASPPPPRARATVPAVFAGAPNAPVADVATSARPGFASEVAPPQASSAPLPSNTVAPALDAGPATPKGLTSADAMHARSALPLPRSLAAATLPQADTRAGTKPVAPPPSATPEAARAMPRTPSSADPGY